MFLVRTSARLRLAAGAIAAVVAVAAGQRLLASDHQDTPEVELNPRLDINDVFAFPGSSADRIVLAMTMSSPIQGTNASFDNNLLYQGFQHDLPLPRSSQPVRNKVHAEARSRGERTRQ